MPSGSHLGPAARKGGCVRRFDTRWLAFAWIAGCSLIYETGPLTEGSSDPFDARGGGASGRGSGGAMAVAGKGGTSSGSAGSGAQGATAAGSSSTSGTSSVSDGGVAGTSNLNLAGEGGTGEPAPDCSSTYYPDSDGDGYGDDSQAGVDCETPGYAQAGDCDDDEFYNNPGLNELCDGIDNDCDAGTPDQCPLDCLTDNSLNGRIYVFCWHPVQTWAEASALCAGQGMRLARLDDEPEQNYIESWHNEEHSWVGGTDGGSEGTWRWQDGDVFWDQGAALLYYDWNVNEPDNFLGNEHCLMLNSSNWWNDHDCNDPVGLTCERY